MERRTSPPKVKENERRKRSGNNSCTVKREYSSNLCTVLSHYNLPLRNPSCCLHYEDWVLSPLPKTQPPEYTTHPHSWIYFCPEMSTRGRRCPGSIIFMEILNSTLNSFYKATHASYHHPPIDQESQLGSKLLHSKDIFR